MEKSPPGAGKAKPAPKPKPKPKSKSKPAPKAASDMKRRAAAQPSARNSQEVSLAALTAELEQARRLAMADTKGASAATSAIMGKARLHGLLAERRELTGQGSGPVKTEKVNAHELGRRLAFALRGAAETGAATDQPQSGPPVGGQAVDPE